MRIKRLLRPVLRRGVLVSAITCVAVGLVCLWGGNRWGRRDAARALRERANAGRNRWEQISFDASVDYQRRHILAAESVRAPAGNGGTPAVQFSLRNISGKPIAFASGSIQLFDADGTPIGGVAVGVREPINPGQSVTSIATWNIPEQLRPALSGGGAAYFWADYVRYGDDTIQSFAKPARDWTYVSPPPQPEGAVK